MSFDLFGFDIMPKDSLLGFWFLQFKGQENRGRSAVCLYYAAGDWFIDFAFIRLT